MNKLYFILITCIIIVVVFIKIMKKNKRMIYISLTTSPERIDQVYRAIEHIYDNQTMKPDKIILNLPYVFKRNNTVFTELPEWLNNYKDVIIINRCEDIGPITKILPSIQLLKNEDDIVISVDDDIKYPRDLIEAYINVADKDCNCIVTSHCDWMRGHDNIKCVEGWKGILYRKKHFKNFDTETVNISNNCFTADDLTLTNHLYKNNVTVKYIKLNSSLDPMDYGLKEDALHIMNDNHKENYTVCANQLEEKNKYFIGVKAFFNK